MAKLNYWSDEETAEMKRLFHLGLSSTEIAAEMKRSKQAIHNAVRRCHLSFRDRNATMHPACKVKKVKAAEPGYCRRPCLKCREYFASAGNHHRICDACKSTNAGYVGVVYG